MCQYWPLFCFFTFISNNFHLGKQVEDGKGFELGSSQQDDLPTTWDLLGEVGLNLALGLVSSCHGR